jgi:hypothetical protein
MYVPNASANALLRDEVNTALSVLLDEIRRNAGFLDDRQLARLAELDRLRQVLVRCGCGRFLCPAQDAKEFIDMVNAHATNYVRDVSLPARGGVA